MLIAKSEISLLLNRNKFLKVGDGPKHSHLTPSCNGIFEVTQHFYKLTLF